MKRTEKPLTQDELQRYERALTLWEQGLKKETADLDAREAELEAREKALGIEWEEDRESIYALSPESVRNALEDAGRYKPKSLVFDDDGCTITPQEFVTTIPPCGQKCYEGGEHVADCARMIYLEVERLGNL